MNDSLVVRVFQARGNLRSDVTDILDRHRTYRRFAHNQLHDQRAAFESVNRSNVRMVQCCEYFRFPLETSGAVGIVGKGFRQDFHRNIASEFRVHGAIDLTHPASA